MSSFPSYPWMQPASERMLDRLGFKKTRNDKRPKKSVR